MDRSTLIRFDTALPLDAPPRPDLYGPVHKGLRALMFDTLTRLGRCDAGDAPELAQVLAAARTLLWVCERHLHHENVVVHAAMESRRPGSSAPTADDHAGHADAIAALRAQVDATEAVAPALRARALHRLYLRFVAENLEHMEVEETHNAWTLRDAFDDAELGRIHDRILESIPPEEMALFMRWILAAVSHGERVAMLADMRANAPAPAFDGTVALCRDLLAPNDWAKLANALALPAGAGIVEAW
jgi:hypothetical protein